MHIDRKATGLACPFQELGEAQPVAQTLMLEQTLTGRTLLLKLGYIEQITEDYFSADGVTMPAEEAGAKGIEHLTRAPDPMHFTTEDTFQSNTHA